MKNILTLFTTLLFTNNLFANDNLKCNVDSNILTTPSTSEYIENNFYIYYNEESFYIFDKDLIKFKLDPIAYKSDKTKTFIRDTRGLFLKNDYIGKNNEKYEEMIILEEDNFLIYILENKDKYYKEIHIGSCSPSS